MLISEELKQRGLIYQVTDEELYKKLDQGEVTLYCGVDPTGDSLHIGHLLPFVTAERIRRAGNKNIFLVGGATGSIGDPSGKKSERQLLSDEEVANNAKNLKGQLEAIFEDTFICHNNMDFFKDMSVIEYLRDFGKLFNVNNMIAKDIVSSRLETGISYTEFSYQILQAMDFNYLYTKYGCNMQIGGSDQWGNITAGLDLIRKKNGPEAKAYGMTFPLITKADGTKFGKSEGGAIWLDASKTSEYELYQFLFNTADSDVIKFLKYFTFLSLEEINELEKSVEEEPFKRLAQKTLATELTKFIHGEEGLNKALKVTEALFSGEIKELTVEEIEVAFNNAPAIEYNYDSENVIEFLVNSTVCASKREAREFVNNGAIFINGEKVENEEVNVEKTNSFGNKYTVVRRGKKKYFLVK